MNQGAISILTPVSRASGNIAPFLFLKGENHMTVEEATALARRAAAKVDAARIEREKLLVEKRKVKHEGAKTPEHGLPSPAATPPQ
jgi:hypothetical protein